MTWLDTVARCADHAARIAADPAVVDRRARELAPTVQARAEQLVAPPQAVDLDAALRKTLADPVQHDHLQRRRDLIVFDDAKLALACGDATAVWAGDDLGIALLLRNLGYEYPE